MEIEIKVRAKSFLPVRLHLKELHARYVSTKHQVDYYYSPYKRPFRKKDFGDVIRVRHDVLADKARLEYHQPKNDYAAIETELEVGDIRTVKKILALMKCKLECIVDKKREYYKRGLIEIVLDKVKGLGTFVEVEIIGADSSRNRKLVVNFLHQLGFSKKDFMFEERYHSMVLAKKGKKYAYF